MSHISEFEEEVRKRHELRLRQRKRRSGIAQDLLKNASCDIYRYSRMRENADPTTRIATPKSKRISFAADLIAAIEEEDNPGAVEELCGLSWSVYRVSPLFGIPPSNGDDNDNDENAELRERYFRDVSSKLSGRLTGSLEAEIKPVRGLRGSRDDSSALKITVRNAFNGRVHDISICTCYLIGVDAKEFKLEETKVEVLPALLGSGPRALVEEVAEELQSAFDCVISKVEFTREDCRWMFALWCGLESSTTSEDVSATFKHPRMKGIDVMKVGFKADRMRTLWKRIHNASESEFTLKELDSFYDSLYKHLDSVYGIHFQRMTLNHFVLPVLTVDKKGTVEIHDKKHLKTVLRYLTDMCQGSFLSIRPRLGVEVETFGF